MKFSNQIREPLSLNMTPLIDVVFLLLIFFMTSTTFVGKQSTLEITLPSLHVKEGGDLTEAIRLEVSSNGTFRVNDHSVSATTVEAIKAAIQSVQAFDPETVMVVTADETAPYQAVIRAMDAARLLGYEHIQLMGEQR